MVGVRLAELRKDYPDGTTAVSDLNLQIEDQEFLTLLGPSGCGKSTTLRLIAGLESPTRGDIFFGTRMVNDLSPARRNIAMVFQSYALYPHMTVSKNIAYPLKKRKVSKHVQEQKVAETARLLQIEHLLHRLPKQLSGGQQQRVALGRAIVRDPEVFLLDEPLSNLDAALRSHMRSEICQLHKRLGKTMIYVTHDQMEAMTMSTRIAVMYNGLLQQIGTPSDIYERPINRMVAAFVGTSSMNFLEGELRRESDIFCFHNSNLNMRLPKKLGEEVGRSSQTRRVSIGVRPEDIIVGRGIYNANVLLVEPMGFEAIVMMGIGEQRVVVRVGRDIPVKVGEQVCIDFPISRLHVFDSEQGIRLG